MPEPACGGRKELPPSRNTNATYPSPLISRGQVLSGVGHLSCRSGKDCQDQRPHVGSSRKKATSNLSHSRTIRPYLNAQGKPSLDTLRRPPTYRIAVADRQASPICRQFSVHLQAASCCTGQYQDRPCVRDEKTALASAVTGLAVGP